jgi:hypothetical protein
VEKEHQHELINHVICDMRLTLRGVPRAQRRGGATLSAARTWSMTSGRTSSGARPPPVAHTSQVSLSLLTSDSAPPGAYRHPS